MLVSRPQGLAIGYGVASFGQGLATRYLRASEDGGG